MMSFSLSFLFFTIRAATGSVTESKYILCFFKTSGPDLHGQDVK